MTTTTTRADIAQLVTDLTLTTTWADRTATCEAIADALLHLAPLDTWTRHDGKLVSTLVDDIDYPTIIDTITTPTITWIHDHDTGKLHGELTIEAVLHDSVDALPDEQGALEAAMISLANLDPETVTVLDIN